MKAQGQKPGQSAAAAERAERLKAALRDNLKKRKAQARARTDDGSDADDAEKEE